jgi:hypothetical protein
MALFQDLEYLVWCVVNRTVLVSFRSRQNELMLHTRRWTKWIGCHGPVAGFEEAVPISTHSVMICATSLRHECLSERHLCKCCVAMHLDLVDLSVFTNERHSEEHEGLY